jgi:hypothetical protein
VSGYTEQVSRLSPYLAPARLVRQLRFQPVGGRFHREHMHWPTTHFLSDHFPDLAHPAYQTTAEKLTFIVVTAMLIGSLVGAIVMIVAEV